jgi:replicative DNA helicase
VEKFSLKNQQAVILRLINEPFLIEKFYDDLRPEDFSQNQQDIKKQALGRMIDVLLTYYREKSIDKLNRESFHARLNSYADSEVNDETRKMFSEMIADKDLIATSENDGILEVFMEILQRNMTIRWFQDFKRSFASYEMKGAITKGREFFERLEQVKIQDEADFDYRELASLFDEDISNSPDLCLATGLEALDTELCGGLSPSTLSVFVSAPGIGKSQLCSHLVQLCVKQKKHAYVTIVEDRKKTFLPRVLSGLCKIPNKRLKTEFSKLTEEEKIRFNKAVVDMRTYIKLDFLYDSNMSEIHRRKLEWRRYCALHNLPIPTVDFLDYSGHIACTSAGDKTHEKYLAAYTTRKNYCLKHNVIGIDFAQVNREGSKKMAGDDVITMNDLASSFDIARVCDNIITINRNDDQKMKDKAIWYIAKIRDGGVIGGNKFECTTNFDYGNYDLLNAVNLSRVTSSIKSK